MHLFALIPSQGASQLLRQLADVLGKRSNNSRRVLAGDLDEHREAGIALDQGGDVRIVRSGKKVSFPMPRYSAPFGHSSGRRNALDAFCSRLVRCGLRATLSNKTIRGKEKRWSAIRGPTLVIATGGFVNLLPARLGVGN